MTFTKQTAKDQRLQSRNSKWCGQERSDNTVRKFRLPWLCNRWSRDVR